MKINFAKILRIAGRLILAAPAIIDAVRPVIAKRRRPRPEERAPDSPTAPEVTRNRG